MGFESLYENKDSAPIATAPGSTLTLSLPCSATKCLESVHCLPLTHSLTLCSLTATSTLLRLLLGVTFLLSLFDIFFFCTCYLKHLKTANYSLPERCPETPLLSGLKDTILLPFSVLAFFSLVPFSHLPPSPSEDFPKGFANGRSHLFLQMVQVTCFHLSFRGPFSSYSPFVTLCLPKYWLSSSRHYSKPWRHCGE